MNMKVGMISEPGKLILYIDLEEDDRPTPTNKYQIGKRIITTIFPEDFDPEDIHPDLLGLSCILICEPFIGTRITLPKPVSKHFYEGHKKVTSRYTE